MQTTYAGNRLIIDVDSHILEPVGWLKSYADPSIREDIPELGDDDPEFTALLKQAAMDHQRRMADPEFQAVVANDYMKMSRKGWLSLGGWDPTERS
ncbi:MAG: hypothetical protein ACKO2Q_12685, partial [Actinomycetota bacterium]